MFHQCQEEEQCAHTQVEHMVEGAVQSLVGSLRPLPSRVDVELVIVLPLTDVQRLHPGGRVGVWVCIMCVLEVCDLCVYVDVMYVPRCCIEAVLWVVWCM